MTPNFTKSELEFSATGVRLGIKNICPQTGKRGRTKTCLTAMSNVNCEVALNGPILWK